MDRDELIKGLVNVIDNLPQVFINEGLGEISLNAHLIIEFITAFKLTEAEALTLLDLCTEVQEEDKPVIIGFSQGKLRYCMGDYIEVES